MQMTKKQLTPTSVELTMAATTDQLQVAKEAALQELAKDLKLAGFRKGHAPAAMVEKVVDQQLLQNTVIERVINELYGAAVTQERLRPVAQPEVNVTKFVPFTTLEVTAAVEVVGDVKLPDYTKFKAQKTVEKVTAADIETVLTELRGRSADKKEVKRAAGSGDEVTIDFAGVDAKTKESISGASGSEYPLVLGSGAFIPGFEPEINGMKTGEEKTFTVTFPKDYPAAELQHKKVTFTVTVKQVKAVTLPKLDDTFAAGLGPFKTLDELKTDIRRQLEAEKERQAQQLLENQVLSQLAEKTTVQIPATLIEQEMDRMDEDEKRNLIYRGQTWQEHLKAEGKTEEEHREGQREQATIRIKTGLALGEVAERENIQVSQAQLDERLKELKKQYQDAAMRAELDKTENQRDILSRMLTEQTIAKLISYATS